MNNPHDQQDALLDANLRAIGRMMELPSVGAPLRWKHIPEPETGQRRFAISRRGVAVLCTAAAAVLAFSAFLYPGGPGSTAVASSIFRSIREGSHRNLSFTFDGLGNGGLFVSGRVQMIFDESVTLAQLFRSGAGPEPEWLGFHMRLRGKSDGPRLDGLDCEIAASLTHDAPWAYFRLDQLPHRTTEFFPFLNHLVPTLRSGLILELDSPEQLMHRVAGMDPAMFPGTPSGNTGDASGRSESPLERMVFDFLSGRAGGDRIAELVARIEEVADRVATRRVGGTEWELRASGFRVAELDPEEAALLGDASLLIRYTQGQGLIEVELTDIGPTHGRIRLGFDDRIDPRLEDKAIFTASGAQSLRLADVIRMFD